MDLLEEVNFDVRDVDHAVSSKIFSHGGSFGIAVSLDFIFGIFAFFSINHHLITRVRDNILKSKEQKNIQPTKGGHKMVTCQNYVSLFYRQITSCPSDGGIS